jgi:flagellar protein FlgJ
MSAIQPQTPIDFSATPNERRPNLEQATKEFEAMFLTQLLKLARESNWTGKPTEEAGSDSYREFAEEHLANAIAAQGSLGLDRLIRQQLEPETPPAPSSQLRQVNQPTSRISQTTVPDRGPATHFKTSASRQTEVAAPRSVLT